MSATKSVAATSGDVALHGTFFVHVTTSDY